MTFAKKHPFMNIILTAFCWLGIGLIVVYVGIFTVLLAIETILIKLGIPYERKY